MRLGGRTRRGKAYLETDYLLFRGDERVKVALQDPREVEASDGVLKLQFPGGPAELELGKAAERWAAKILRPPSRADKLYVAERREELVRVPKLAAGAALWIVYPKGVAAIREAEVIAAGRGAGLKDVKVARFSATHTALKFVP